MKRLTLVVLLFVLALGATMAQAQIKFTKPTTTTAPATSAAPAVATPATPAPAMTIVATPVPPTPEAPATTTVRIVTDTLPPIEATRKTSLNIKVEGEFINMSLGEGSELRDLGLGAKFITVQAYEPGDYKLNVVVKVGEEKAPTIATNKEFTLHVVPFVRTLDDIEEHLNIVAKGNDLDNLSTALTDNATSNHYQTRRLVNRTNALLQLERKRTERLNQKLNWILYGFAGILWIGLIIRAIDLFKGRKKSPPPNKDHEAKVLQDLGYRAGAILIAGLLLGSANIAFAQAPAPVAPAPAAKPVDTVKIISINPTDVGLGQDSVVLTIGLNKVVKVVDKAEINGLTVEKTELAKNGKTVTITTKPTATTTTGSQIVLTINGQAIESGEKLGVTLWAPEFYELVTRMARLQSQIAAGDPTARHFLQALFQYTLGDEAGNKEWANYKKKPTHVAAGNIIAQTDANLARDLGIYLNGNETVEGALTPIRQGAAAAQVTATNAVKTANAGLDGIDNILENQQAFAGAIKAIGATKVKTGIFKSQEILPKVTVADVTARGNRIEQLRQAIRAAREAKK